jgi:hypothetical protein
MANSHRHLKAMKPIGLDGFSEVVGMNGGLVTAPVVEFFIPAGFAASNFVFR